MEGAVNAGAATICEAKWTADGRPEFEAADFKELEARSRGPDVLTPQEEGLMAEAKEDGNGHFRAGRVKEALQAYNRALEVFADRKGGPSQRLEKSRLCANRAECLLRLEHWEGAVKSASLALSLDATNAKARFRRARALVALGGEARLASALDDLHALRAADGQLGRAEAQLHKTLLAQQAELKEVRRRDAGGLRKAFAEGTTRLGTDAVDSGHGGGSPADAPTDVSDGAAHGSGAAPPEAASWAAQLSEYDDATKYAWLVDVYRTRVDDDGAKGGAHGHGIRALAPSAAAVVLDFALFCTLARERGLLAPAAHWPWWRWEVCLEAAATMLSKAFRPEVCRAELRYGALMGDGARLRAAGHVAYADEHATASSSSSVGGGAGGGGGGGGRRTHEVVRRELEAACWRDGGVDDDGRRIHMLTFDRAPEAFAPIGGALAWKRLLAQVGRSPPFG